MRYQRPFLKHIKKASFIIYRKDLEKKIKKSCSCWPDVSCIAVPKSIILMLSPFLPEQTIFSGWKYIHLLTTLKVPSGQMVSTWEWHHWIGLFDFLISLLNIWKTSCLFGSRSAYNPVFLLALLFDEKNRHSAALFWFVLLDVGILYSRAVIQRIIDVFPAVLEHCLAEKIPVCAHANCDPNKQEVGFISAWSSSELWTLLRYSRSKIKKIKNL